MKWFRVDKEKTIQPTTGDYRDWKAMLATEGLHQCVYCAVHEVSFGGTRNFHVEHYKPKSLFDALKNDVKNLFYACPICNTFKSDDWPCDPTSDLSIACYPDPSMVDYNHIFMESLDMIEISGKNTAARYMIQKLYLNRPQLLLERRQAYAQARIDAVLKKLGHLELKLVDHGDDKSKQLLLQLLKQYRHTTFTLNQIRQIIPYQEEDISR